MESAGSQAVLKAYKDVLRSIVSLVSPTQTVEERTQERLLGTIILAVTFGVVVMALWHGAWKYPVTLVSLIVGSTFITLAAVMARGRK